MPSNRKGPEDAHRGPSQVSLVEVPLSQVLEGADGLERKQNAASVPPPPPAAAPGPLTLQDIHPMLCKPFSRALVELKPQTVSKDRSSALVAAYVDARAYQTRLDRAAGPGGWSVTYRETLTGVICRLTILGVTREDVGDVAPATKVNKYGEETPEENRMTSAAMQAFKRACAAFGLGRYLYSLPLVWADYDDQKKQIRTPAGIIAQMYESIKDE